MPAGRPTKYKKEYARKARMLCEKGATDEEIADFFDVSTRTIYRWRLENDEFCQSLKAGKDLCDDRIERSLFQKASGYRFTEQQAIKVKTGQYSEEVEVVDVERQAPPDTTAQIFWLKNRRPNEWRDRQEIKHDVDGSLAQMILEAQKRAGLGG